MRLELYRIARLIRLSLYKYQHKNKIEKDNSKSIKYQHKQQKELETFYKITIFSVYCSADLDRCVSICMQINYAIIFIKKIK